MSKKKYLPLFIALFSIVLLGAGCGAVTEKSTENQEQNQEKEFKNRIIIQNQDAKEGQVTAQTVISAQKGWLVIHIDENGAPGEVVGFSQIKEGINDNVSINIDLEKSTSKLHAMLHIDEGVDGEYEFPGDDSPATSENGQVVTRPFNIVLSENEGEDGDLLIDVDASANTQTEVNLEDRFGNEKVETVSLSKTFNITSDSTVSYTAQKKWLSKDAEAVTGTNDEVKGTLVYNAKNKTLESFSATINSQTFKTNSGARDNDVRKLLGNSSITIENASLVNNLGLGNFSKSIPMKLTINGITKTVNFDVNGTIQDSVLTGTGSATIDMTDFNITPPSILKVYSVDKNLTISLNVTAN